MADDLKKETIKGVGWSFADNIIKLGVSFVVSVIMARILTPNIYGVVGIVTIFTSLFSSFIDCGLSTALIRKKEVTDDDYSTMFIANFTIALFFYLILFLCAPFFSSFFNIEGLTVLLRVAGLCILIDSLSLIQKTILTKRIDFKTQTKITAIAGLSSGVIGICMAVSGYGVWALVAQILSSCTFITMQLWIYNRWCPKLAFSWGSFKAMFGFGWKLMVIGLMSTLWNDIYNFVIGKFYSSTSLGLYNRAQQFSDLISRNMTTVVQRVSLPVLSKMQDDEDRMKSVYIRSIRLTAYVSFVLLFGLSGISKSLIYVLLGEKWMLASEYLPLVAINVLLYPVGVINLNMIALKGRSDLCLYVEMIKKVFAIIPIVVGVFVNIKTMLVVSICVSTMSYFLNCYYSKRVIEYTIGSQVKDIAPSFFISISMFVMISFMNFMPISFYVLLPLQIVSGGVFVLLISRIFKMHEYYEIKNILLMIKAKFNR